LTATEKRGQGSGVRGRSTRPLAPDPRPLNEVIDQCRLADARLAGDEDHLPGAARGACKGLLELREHCIATDKVGGRAPGIGGRCPRPLTPGPWPRPLNHADPAVTAAVYGLDEAWLARIIREGFAQLIDREFEHAVADVGIRPGSIEQLILCDDLIRLLHQATQDEEGLRPQIDTAIAPPDTLVRLVYARRFAGIDHAQLTCTQRSNLRHKTQQRATLPAKKLTHFFRSFESKSRLASMCPGDPPPSIHWEIFKPPGLNSVLYTASGISGYHGPVLTITLNVTGESKQVFFRFDYQQSVLTLTMSTDCQTIGHLQDPLCTIEATNGLPANEPT